uniref:Uncharacterized protein n=1 Tax=Coccidioides posadasii RMSCC 3488 TaxID=454284 RepID=A0A0J6FKL9_COCPO|nr:hypothetical protein CPAG_05710 [Coccidioides posadasii RMSCC 3488]
MTSLSETEHEVVKSHTLGKSLDHLLEPLQDAERSYSFISSLDGTDDTPEQGYQKAVSLLLSALIDTEAALVLQSRTSSHDIASELFALSVLVRKGDFSYNYYRPLVKLVIQRNPKASDHHIWSAILDLISADSRTTPPPRPIVALQQTPWLQNTSSFANSTEYRKHVDAALKEELGDLHADILGFFEAFFGNIAGLDVAARAVLELVRLAEAPGSALKINRRPLARPTRPLDGSIAARKLDIGFVDDLDATEGSRCGWSQILIPGELKNDQKYDGPSSAWLDLGRYAREV